MNNMKKVIKISIAGVAFSLSEEAYGRLSEYMDMLNAVYDHNPDGREIIADIEARIAELILSEQVCTKTVNRTLVDSIIAQLGVPDESTDDYWLGSLNAESDHSKLPRRLHRLSDGAKLGGIFAGMSQFWDVNVMWFRLVFLLPMIMAITAYLFNCDSLGNISAGLSGIFIAMYILLWMAIPLAKSPRQKLEVRGQRITASSIHHNFQSSVHSPAARKAASVAAEILYVAGRVVIFLVRLVGAMFGFAAGFLAAAGIAALLSVFVIYGWSIVSAALSLGTLTIVIPAALLCYVLLCFAFDWKVSRKTILFAVISWVIILVMCICVAVLWSRQMQDYGNVTMVRALLDAVETCFDYIICP